MRRSSQSDPRNSDRISVFDLYFPASTHTYHSGSADRKPASLQTVHCPADIRPHIPPFLQAARNFADIPVLPQAVRNLAGIPVLLPAVRNSTDIPVLLQAVYNLAGIPVPLQAVRNLAGIPVLLQAVRNLADIPVPLQAARNFVDIRLHIPAAYNLVGIRLRIPAFLRTAHSLVGIRPVRMQDFRYRYQPPAFFLLMLQ